MKMTKKLLMVGAAYFAAAFGVHAETETVGGYTWTYRINGDTAEIYGYHHDSGANVPAISPKPTGSVTTVTIPSTLGGKPVTRIGNYAFAWCDNLTSMTIPDGVTSIGLYAFDCCTRLTSVTIPDSVKSIEAFAFNYCSDSLFRTTTIPGVKLVDGWAVGNTGSLSGVLDLTGVRGIAGYAFRDCKGLTSVTIPDRVPTIGIGAFYGCTNLASVTIPDSVTSIGKSAFYGCTGLTNVTIGNGVTTIGVSAFYGCSGLTGVTIGNSVAIIMSSAFYNCSGLASVTMPDSVTSIGDSAFYNCSMLDSVTIPATVRHIGDGAFAGTPYDATIQAKMSKIVAESSESDDKGYSLVDGSRAAEDRTIASVAVDGDCAIDDFVLKDGVVYDSVLRIVNTAPNEVKVTLPSGYVYETIGTASPLVLPASSKSLLTITRTADRTFLVTRQTLNVIQ